MLVSKIYDDEFNDIAHHVFDLVTKVPQFSGF